MATRLTMTGNLKSAQTILQRALKADAIGKRDLQKAQGIVFLSSLKGAWFFSGAIGRGFFIKRNDDDSWSNPVAIVMAQGGAGLQFGLHKEQLVLVLKSRAEVRRFQNVGSLQISADLSISAGGTGGVVKGGVAVNQRSLSGVSAFAVSRGIFFGISLEGAIISTNPPQNQAFYDNARASQQAVFHQTINVPPGKRRDAVTRLHHVLANLQAGRPMHAQPEKLAEKLRNAPEKVPVAQPIPSDTEDDLSSTEGTLRDKKDSDESLSSASSETPPQRVTSFIFE